MKKTITISFLLLLSFSQPGYYFFYLFQQYRVKESVKHELLAKPAESSLKIIDGNAHKNDIERKEQDKEFYLHGLMYDVSCIKISIGTKPIYYLNKSKEEDLLKRFANALKPGNKQNSTSKHGHHIIKLQPSHYVMLSSQYTTSINERVSAAYIEYSFALITIITDISTPPPDLILKNKT